MRFITPKKDNEYFSQGYSFVIGIDEVGRGCWAGPVGVGAFVLEREKKYYKGVNDSKKLDLDARKNVYKKLKKHTYQVKYGEVEQINKVGIGKTIESLITELIDLYKDQYGNDAFFIVDGQFSKNFGKNTQKAIKADSTYYSVASASILAKVERDLLMTKLHKLYPQYGFNKNKGYATQFHRNVLNEIGVCELHRQSFEPIYNLSHKELLSFEDLV